MTEGILKDFDNLGIFQECQEKLVKPHSLNFVLEFGEDEAGIAFDLDKAAFDLLLNHDDPPRDPKQRPVRWINLWAPNKQPEIVEVIGDYYSLSTRFKAILRSPPTLDRKGGSEEDNRHDPRENKMMANNDIEMGKTIKRQVDNPEEVSHYTIASNLVNYQLVDQDDKFLCIGANWMHNFPGTPTEKRLFSWLFLCYDSTVISIHEDPQVDDADEAYMKIVRGHTINVLNQISTQCPNSGSVSLISVRKFLKVKQETTKDLGFEGSSNLFYYLFDNWHATYRLILGFKSRLGALSKDILAQLEKKHIYDVNKHIIPEIYKIGKALRKNQQLYEGYKNLIKRILECKETEQPSSAAVFSGGRQIREHVEVARSAIHRFNRLEDHIRLLVLSSLSEAIGENDALLSTHFNITAQKDSQATSRLSQNATLLSKLGVLFLPVSLVTSYFSIQIQELQGVYTARTYWVTFTIVLVLSFIVLFLLSRFLMQTMEKIEGKVKDAGKLSKRILGFN